MRDSVRINPALKVILRSRWQVQQQAESSSDSNWQMQQRATRSSGKPLDQNWNETKSRNEGLQEDDRVEITALSFNKIDLRIDGIPQKKAILQDKKQMKDISEKIQKLEESKVDLVENSNTKFTFLR